MKTKHTPGPWFATVQGSDTIYIHDAVKTDGPSFGTICEIGSDSNYPDIHATDKANAHLIAAAPDLLVACELALSNLSLPTGVGHTQLMRVKQILSEAINKAGGIN